VHIDVSVVHPMYPSAPTAEGPGTVAAQWGNFKFKSEGARECVKGS